jgi:hypothetical protein
MERSPDRFLVIQLEKEGIRPRCRYPYMLYGIDFTAADLDFLLTKSQVQMASKDVSGSFEKWNDGRVGPEWEPCSHEVAWKFRDQLFSSWVLRLRRPTAHVTIVIRHQDRAGAGYTTFGTQLLLELRRTIVRVVSKSRR